MEKICRNRKTLSEGFENTKAQRIFASKYGIWNTRRNTSVTYPAVLSVETGSATAGQTRNSAARSVRTGITTTLQGGAGWSGAM